MSIFQHFKFQDFKILTLSGFQHFNLEAFSTFQHFNLDTLPARISTLKEKQPESGMFESWRVSRLKCWNLEKFQGWNVEMLRMFRGWSVHFSRLKCWNVQISRLKCWNVKFSRLKCWHVQISRLKCCKVGGRREGLVARAKFFRYFGVVSVSVQCRDWHIF